MRAEGGRIERCLEKRTIREVLEEMSIVRKREDLEARDSAFFRPGGPSSTLLFRRDGVRWLGGWRGPQGHLTSSLRGADFQPIKRGGLG